MTAIAMPQQNQRSDHALFERRWTPAVQAPPPPLEFQPAKAHRFIYRHGVGLTFNLNRVQLPAEDHLADFFIRAVGDDDSRSVILIQRLEARSEVDVVAHDGVAEPP